MNMTWVGDKIAFRAHTRRIDGAAVVESLKRAGIRLVVNVARQPHDDLQYLCGKNDILYVHEEFPDGRIMDFKKIEALLNMIGLAMGSGNVLVHCEGGHNRSAMLAIMAEARRSQRSAGQLLDESRQKKHRVVENPYFEKWMRSL